MHSIDRITRRFDLKLGEYGLDFATHDARAMKDVIDLAYGHLSVVQTVKYNRL